MNRVVRILSRTTLTVVWTAALVNAQNPAPALAPGNVTLPLDEYNRLIDAANRPVPAPSTPPADYVLKAADLKLKVAGESVTGTIQIDGEVLSTGVHKVPLSTDLTVLNARRDGGELALEQSDGTHTAVLPGPGAFTVTLDVAMPLSIETGRASFYLPAPAAGAVRLRLEVPGAQTLVSVVPGLVTGRTNSGNTTVIEATLAPGERANIAWAARLPVTPPAEQEVRFTSDVKTLISVAESEIDVAALTELEILRGEPTEFTVDLPEGFDLTGVTGPTLVSNSLAGRQLKLAVNNGAARSHQFLISLSRTQMATKSEVPLVSLAAAQRESGEVLVEGLGAMELAATELGGLRRMDLREANIYLRSLSTATMHAAFRYQRHAPEVPAVALEWERFPESDVLSAVAQSATATTLVTSEGRSLTEVRMILKNRAQPFLKLDLPPGGSLLTSEVAGEAVKPVMGADGSRVPLFRPGFQPAGDYEVSFVFLHADAPFERKGDAELALPRMDIPIARLEWEVFLPERYKVSKFDGDAVLENLFPTPADPEARVVSYNALPILPLGSTQLAPGVVGPYGQMSGIVTDQTGAVIPNAPVEIRNRATGAIYKVTTTPAGQWIVSQLPAGQYDLTVEVTGFKTYIRERITVTTARNSRIDIVLEVGQAAETVTVTSQASLLKTESSSLSYTFSNQDLPVLNVDGQTRAREPEQSVGIPGGSSNVQSFQRRVAGVLPIPVNVPRAGTSYSFVRPLVLSEETTLTFRYRRR